MVGPIGHVILDELDLGEAVLVIQMLHHVVGGRALERLRRKADHEVAHDAPIVDHRLRLERDKEVVVDVERLVELVRPVAVAFEAAALELVARAYDYFDVVLDDHAYEVGHGLAGRPLARNVLVLVVEGAINEARIYVITATNSFIIIFTVLYATQ